MNGVAAKLDRAIEHLGELEAYLHSGGLFDPVVEKVVTEASSCSYLVTVRQQTPPLRVAAVFGDILHNLRSALDYLARDLVLANGGTPIDKTGGTTFPVRDARPAELIDIRPGISLAARGILSELQPFSLGARFQTSSLWQLQELENADKHRLLHIVVWSGGGRLAFGPAASELVVGEATRLYAVELRDSSPQRVKVDPRDLYDPARAGGSWMWQLVLSESLHDQNTNLIGIARKLIHHVAQVIVPAFADLLQSSQSHVQADEPE